jgi:hypothetical protein
MLCADAKRGLAGLLREYGVVSLYKGLRSKLLMDIIRTVSFHYTFAALKEVTPPPQKCSQCCSALPSIFSGAELR